MFHRTSFSRPFAPALLGLALFGPATALAAGEPCVRDTDCAGAELCVDSACSAADPGVQACTVVDDCAHDEDVCADGFCKFEGVACRNAAGACWVGDGAGRCECGNGEGSGWSDGYNPDDPPATPTDAELQATCVENLVDSCGTEAPALPDSCVGDVLADCEALVAKEDAMAQLCGEDVPEVNIGRIGDCCDTHDDAEYAAYRECVLAIEIGDECPGDPYDACESFAGDTAENDAAEDEQDDDDAQKAGCRTSGPSSPWAVLALFGLSAASRRARRRTRRCGVDS